MTLAPVAATDREAAPVCGPDEHCITCGDQALPMRVVTASSARRLAVCRPAEAGTGIDPGARELVDVELVGEVRRGDLLLVHAGTALLLLAENGEARA